MIPFRTAPASPPRQGISLPYLQTLAMAAHRSGLFRKQFPNEFATLVAIQFGLDLGLSPTTALTSIHFYDGKPSLSANLMWSLVQADPDWEDSLVEESTNQKCVISWKRKGKLRGKTVFTLDDAKTAGLLGKSNWKNYPRAMLFNRAISEGFRMYCPHLGRGYTLYTPDEMGQVTDESGNPVEEASWSEAGSNTFPPPASALPGTGGLGFQSPADELRDLLAEVNMTLQEAASYLLLDNVQDLTDPTPDEVERIRQLVQIRKEVQVS